MDSKKTPLSILEELATLKAKTASSFVTLLLPATTKSLV